jgi:hypothetical protein
MSTTGGIKNLNPLQTTYSAVSSSVSTNNYYVLLLDTNMNTIVGYGYGGSGDSALPNTRYEIIIRGGYAYLYTNGAQVYNGGNQSISLNPSYIYFGSVNSGTHKFDDFVYGDSENLYVVTQPSYTGYKLVKDFITPASSGLRYNNDTVVSSTNMYYRVARGNTTIPAPTLENKTIVLMNIDTGDTYATQYTGTAYIKDGTWNVYDALFNTSAPYGRYYTTVTGTGAVSEEIWYLGSGATISFDKDDYSGEDTATLTYSVLGAYWDTSTYDYAIDIVSGTTGATTQSTAISASSGTQTYTFTATDPLGVYYGIVKATKRSDGSVIWMNYDYAELTSYVTIEGYVNDAETGLPISGANINITQSSIINNLTTITDGNYSATNYLSGAAITINATAPLHRKYTFTFTPLIAKTYNINLSLVNLTPVVSPLGILGVVRDTAYGQPIPAAIVDGVNATAQVTNTSIPITGFYRLNSGTLLNESDYDVHGSKAGYSNSSTDSVNINGSISNYTYNDVWLSGQYLQTFTISDSGTLAPITNVTIVSSSGKSYVTTNGTGYLTEPFGLYTVTFSSTGYAPRTITYVFDADASHAVSMTPAAADASSSYNTWYTPWQVRIRIVDLYGKPLPETSVSASYIATTLPSTDPTWLVGAYGVSAAVAADMLNSSVAMSGTTDDNGGLVFTAFKSIQYLFTITNTTSGVSATKKIYPSDPEYVIYVRTTGQTSYNNTLASRNASLPWYSINSTALMMGMEYTDSSVCTSQVMFRAWFRDNGTEVHNTTWSGFGGTKILDNHTILKAPIGTEYLWGYNATTVC